MLLLGLVVALLVLAVAGAIYQAIATERAERAYPPPGQMVGVGGHSLHINCLGRAEDRLGSLGQGAAGGLRYHARVLLRSRGDGLERDGPRTPGRQADF
jgi:hypothetical protein